ncbi:MAG: hypothetical protein U0X73_18295 [Thermoanaerobaculia bacterium]
MPPLAAPGSTRALSATLRAGALYDFGFAALLVAAPGLPARFLALPTAPAFFLRVLAVTLAMLAAVYLVAARDPRRQAPLVAIAIVGRLAGALALAGSALAEPAWSGLWPLAAADLVFALAHAATWPRGGSATA